MLAAFAVVRSLICFAVLAGFSLDVIELAIVGLPTAGFLLVDGPGDTALAVRAAAARE